MTEMPVDRNYDWTEFEVENLNDYKESGNELSKILADIDASDTSGKLPRYMVSGPTGCGKTHLAMAVADELDAPLFTIQGKYSMNEADLLGMPTVMENETRWSDGKLTKALLASQDREVVILVDEINRARPESKSVLFSALDSRAQVELEARGGEIIKGDPSNIIAVATANEGEGYFTEEMDKAEKRRFSSKLHVDYLGMSEPQKEKELVTERTPAHEDLAEEIVATVNRIRSQAKDKGSEVPMGVPTSTTVNWAQTAYAYEQNGVDNPLIVAAKDSLINPLYDNGKTKVTNIVKDKLDGAPFNEDEFEQWSKTKVDQSEFANKDDAAYWIAERTDHTYKELVNNHTEPTLIEYAEELAEAEKQTVANDVV